jgi:transcriptional regulator with XRE-family HTH domain
MPVSSRRTLGTYIAERRRACGLSQNQLAETLGVTRTIVSAWENDRRRPRADHLDALAQVLDDEGQLTILARYDYREEPPLFETPVRVGDLVRRVGESLIGYLSVATTIADEPGYGWRRDLEDTAEPPSAWDTAYGLRTVALAGCLDWRVSLSRVRDTLRHFELPDGGWTDGSLSGVARPEITAVILAALRDAGESDAFLFERASLVVEMLDRRAPDAELARPYILATSLVELSRLDADEASAGRLVEGLVDLSHVESGARGWPVVVKTAGLQPQSSSTVHTAAAVCAVAAWAHRLGDTGLAEVARDGMTWLERHADLELDDEDVWSEHADGGHERLHVRHFTPAWVILAGRAAGTDPTSGLANRALRAVLSYYLPDAAVWRWPRSGGLYPTWMTYYAVAALMDWAASHQIS